jgi:DNA-binding SARP family transcriptional activator
LHKGGTDEDSCVRGGLSGGCADSPKEAGPAAFCLGGIVMRQLDQVCESPDSESIQCALDFENTMNNLETQLYYRHLPPKEVTLRVMEAACKFYDADWCGLIQVDLDLGLWKPLWWHNECQEDKTTILTHEFESSEFLDRWVKAVRRGTPMVVSDAEEVKDLYPDEYQLYERLGIKSVLAIPLEPRQIALIAVRNPQRYIHQTSMLKLLAYVLLAAYNDKRMADSLSMAFSPENIKSSHDVFISLFGELKIHTSHGVLPESDLKSPKISRLLTFMLLSNKKALSSLEIVQEIWPEELEDKDEPGKKIKQLVYRLRQAFSIISDEQLILSTPSGYQFNPDLNITTDFQMFDELCIAAAKATSTINKVGLLEKAASLYQGKLLSAADGEHWLVHYANRYHLAFMSTVNELLKQLMDFHAYDLLHQDAALALTIAPENTKAYYWLICSYRKQHMDELASGELAAAKQKLPEDEYQKLLNLLEQ